MIEKVFENACGDGAAPESAVLKAKDNNRSVNPWVFNFWQSLFTPAPSRCDFFGVGRSKGEKVVNQASPGFTPFTGFDLAKLEKSQQQAGVPGPTRINFGLWGHDVGS